MARFDPMDFDWSIIEVARVDYWRVLNGIFWRLREGCTMSGYPRALRFAYDVCEPLQPVKSDRRLGRALSAISRAYDGDIQMIDFFHHPCSSAGCRRQKKTDLIAWAARSAD